MVLNQGQITKLAGTPNSGLIDGTDSIHTGVVKALQSFNKGDMCIGHAGFTITDAGTYTQYNLAHPIHFIANNKYTTHGVTLTEAYTSGVQHASHTRYDWVLLNPATPEIVIVQGTAAAVPLVADITAGHIPIALVQITSAGSSDDDKTDYSFQLFTLDKQDNSLSVGYDGGTYYVEGMSITTNTGVTTIENKVSDADVIFKVNDGGSSTEVFRLDGDVSALKMASGKQLQFGDSGEFILGDGTDLTFASGGDINIAATGGDILVTDAATSAASKPTLTLKNTNNGATAPQLIFHSQRNLSASAGQDGDDLGYIYFNGYDDGTPSTQTYGTILGEISDASSGAEEGKIKISVAAHNGTVTEALTIEGSTTGSGVLVNTGILESSPKSVLHVGGAMSLPFRLDTSTSTTLLPTDYILAVANAGTHTATLPALADVGDGRIYRILSYLGAVTVDGNASETIMSSATASVAANEWSDFISHNTGSDWKLIAKGALI